MAGKKNFKIQEIGQKPKNKVLELIKYFEKITCNKYPVYFLIVNCYIVTSSHYNDMSTYNFPRHIIQNLRALERTPFPPRGRVVAQVFGSKNGRNIRMYSCSHAFVPYLCIQNRRARVLACIFLGEDRISGVRVDSLLSEEEFYCFGTVARQIYIPRAVYFAAFFTPIHMYPCTIL